MKIAIVGYGKMGKELEKILVEKKHEIILKTNSKSFLNLDLLKKCDLAFEFTNPKSAYKNIKLCLENKVSVISGTTGWSIRKKNIHNLCIKNKVAFLHSSNFSIGINLIKNIIPELNRFMSENSDFEIKMKEKHHKYKIDSPSGTALDLKNLIKKNKIKIKSDRQEEKQIGCHEIILQSKKEQITIKHQALHRNLFASGAIKYGEKIQNKTGYFDLDLKKIF